MRVLICLLLAFAAVSAQAAELQNLQLLSGADGVRVVFNLDATPAANVFTLANPDRVVVDLDGTHLQASLRHTHLAQGVVKDVRYGHHGKALRVVFDLDHPVRTDHFTLAPAGAYGHRLIVDLSGSAAPSVPTVTASAAAAQRSPSAAIPPPPPPQAVAPVTPAARLQKKSVVVAIDPGHGGDDPGARGPDGVMEKNVTLAIAKRLAALVDAQPGMKAVLTRTGDYYVGLRERMVIARKANADLFVSIHCNAVRDRSVQGTEVYVLSSRGASSEQARWIANRENAADMVGGVDISDKDSQLASVLVDISQSATLDASFDLAGRLMTALGRINPLLHPVVQQAAFVVLKAPDIPSVLVETAFISNPHEEHQLNSGPYQQRIAGALLTGIRGYFSQYRPQQQVPTLQATRRPALRQVNLAANDR